VVPIVSPKPTFADKRNQWLEVLSGKDLHSVVNQITEMAWNMAAFRVVNKARSLAPPHHEGGVQLNGLMHQLLDRGFSMSQMAAVRRLWDTSSPLEGKKGVYSLAKLLEDMSEHHHLFTREAIFEAEALKYDCELIRQKANEYIIEQRKAGKTAYFLPPGLDSFVHENRHEQIDRLAGVAPSDRRPDDTIQKDVFFNLTAKVQTACEDVKNHATKLIAHAAAPKNREAVVVEITLNHLDNAHRNLCQVTSFIATYILGDSCPPPLPVPQYNQFKYIERPLIDRDQVPELQEVWNQFDEDCNDWSQWALDDYEQEFSKKP